MTKVEYFDFSSLENRVIDCDLILGKYTAHLFLIAYQGEPIKLDIDLSWKNTNTIDVFNEIGKFCSKIGSCIKVEIGAGAATIRLALTKESNSKNSIIDLARAINRIRFILETCLVSKCPMVSESDGLQKSDDFAAKYISDAAWNKRKEKSHPIDPKYAYPPRNSKNDIADFYEKLK